MKIGILTFHSQLNYGALLQAVALRIMLKKHFPLAEVRVIDCWMRDGNEALLGPFVKHSPLFWMKYLKRSLRGMGFGGMLCRHWRTIQFVKKCLNLTPEHFRAWSEPAAQSLDLDLVVVGSDQVWNPCIGQAVDPYLLEGAPAQFKAISYAASFGMTNLPEELLSFYQQGFKRFSAISCRESEGVKHVEFFGRQATLVCDPVQHLSKQEWESLLRHRPAAHKRPLLVCYFLDKLIEEMLPLLVAYAVQHSCEVQIFGEWNLVFDKPKRSHMCDRMRHQLLRRARAARVRICRGAAPLDFVQAIAEASWVVTESFHGLQFCSIFHKNLRLIRPQSSSRTQMFARISEFCDKATSGTVYADTFEGALQSLETDPPTEYNETFLEDFRSRSRAWLKDAVQKTLAQD